MNGNIKHYTLLCLTLLLFFTSNIANSIVINQQKFVTLGGDPDNISGTIAAAFEQLRIKSLTQPYLSVGTFIGKSSEVCTGTWVGNEGLNAVILTSASCVFDNGTASTAGNYTFKSFDGRTIAAGNGIAYFPPDHVLKPDRGYDGATTNITIVKLPFSSFIVSDQGIVNKPIIDDIGSDNFKPFGQVGIGYWGVGETTSSTFGPVTGIRRAHGESLTGAILADGRGVVSYYFPFGESVFWSKGGKEDVGASWFQIIDGYTVITGVLSNSASEFNIYATRATYYSHWIKTIYSNIRLLSEVKAGTSGNVGSLGSSIDLPSVRDAIPASSNPGDLPSFPSVTTIVDYGVELLPDPTQADLENGIIVFSENGQVSDSAFYRLKFLDVGPDGESYYGFLPAVGEDNENFEYITSSGVKAMAWIDAHKAMSTLIRDGRQHRAGTVYVWVNSGLTGPMANRMEAWLLQANYQNDLPAIPLNQESKSPWVFLGKVETKADVVKTRTNGWAEFAFNTWGEDDRHGTRCLVVGQQMPWRSGQVDAFQLRKDAVDEQYGALPGCEGCSNEWWLYIGHGSTGDFAQHMNELETICRRTKTRGDEAIRGALFFAQQGTKEVLFMYQAEKPKRNYMAFPALGEKSNDDWLRILDRDKLQPFELQWAQILADAFVWSTDRPDLGEKGTVHYYRNPKQFIDPEDKLERFDFFVKLKDGNPLFYGVQYPDDKGTNDWWRYVGGNIREATINAFKFNHNIKQLSETGTVGDIYYRIVNNSLYFYRLWFKDATSLGYGAFPSLTGNPNNTWWRLIGKSIGEAIVNNKLLGVANDVSVTQVGNVGSLYFFYNPNKAYQLEFFVLTKSPYGGFPQDGTSSNQFWERVSLDDFVTMAEAESFYRNPEVVFATQSEIDKATDPQFLQDTFMRFSRIKVEVSSMAWAERFTLPTLGFNNEQFTIFRTSTKNTSVDQGKGHIYFPQANETKTFVFKRYDDTTFLGDWIPDGSKELNTQFSFNEYLQTEAKTVSLYEKYSFIYVEVSNNIIINNVFLPSNGRNGQSMIVEVKSDAVVTSVAVNYSGSTEIVSKGQVHRFKHNGQKWIKEP